MVSVQEYIELKLFSHAGKQGEAFKLHVHIDVKRSGYCLHSRRTNRPWPLATSCVI